jgi:hypothetical protein
MAVMRSRRVFGACLVAFACAVAGSAVVARGTTSRATSWGTFAHVAAGNITTSAARQTVAQNYDALALRGNVTSELLSDLHQRRAGIVLLTYEKAAGLNGAEANDFRTTHPTWLARDASGNVIHPRSDVSTTLGDLTNADFRAWSAQKFAAEVGLGADGAFIDTLGAFFPSDFYTARPYVAGQAVTDAAWRDGSVDLIRRIKAATGRLVIANGFGLGSGATYFPAAADADQLIAAADGVQIENFTRAADAAPTTYRAADKWDQDLAFLESLGTRGKIAFAYTKLKSAASASELATVRDYAVGSFLAAFAPGRSYFGFDDGLAIPQVSSDPAWARNLGLPTGARARSGTDGWSRPFQTGLLTVRVATAPVVSATPTSTSTSTSTSTTSPSTTSTSTTSTTRPPTTTTSTTRPPTTTTSTTAPPTGRYVRVLSPNGGEQWKLGQPHTVSFSGNQIAGYSVVVYLLRNGTLAATIGSATAGSNSQGSITWTPPTNTQPGSAYTVQAVVRGVSPSPSDTSDAPFSLVA